MLQLFSLPLSAMASACATHLYGDDRTSVEAIAEAAIAEVARIEQRYSRYRSDSVLAEINEVAERGQHHSGRRNGETTRLRLCLLPSRNAFWRSMTTNAVFDRSVKLLLIQDSSDQL